MGSCRLDKHSVLPIGAPLKKNKSIDMLPMTRKDMQRLGWKSYDILLVTGDAYVDHPSFGTALLGRWLASHGFRVAICSQPDWRHPNHISHLGRPRLFAGVTAGALDSMLAHYTAFRKKRTDDAYTPGGQAGARPNRATIVYTGLVRRAFPGLPVIIGGIEASLRRVTHYDFWQDNIRRSVLLDSKADVLVYGMAERSVLEIAKRLDKTDERALEFKGAVSILSGIASTVTAVSQDVELGATAVALPSHEEILETPSKIMKLSLAMERHVHQGNQLLTQAVGDRQLVITPPAEPLTTEELDELYALPFTRQAHPQYKEPVPALDMIRFSITSHRGCAGGCSFCSLALHQGRQIRSRSEESLTLEVASLTGHPEWKGSVSDVGGPTANMWGAECGAPEDYVCKRPSCLVPTPCTNFKANQRAIMGLLRRIANLPGVKHLRVASGVRHDLAAMEGAYTRDLVQKFVGGQLKVAPEHCQDKVLRLMRKPLFSSFNEFVTVFEKESKAAGKEQYIVPYLMSGFPGCRDEDMKELKQWLKKRGWRPQQVQCFIPTPGTVATAMYMTRKDTRGKTIYVAKTDAQRLRQHGILVDEKPERRRSKSRSGKAPKKKTGRRGRK